ncbi:MAG: M20/M25/M40 family metallo-hydrolase, partial [Myxococcales bacterium]|nr:M20/M25/M40 family metallo-hydrolase [Myxococcales bacterium]
MASQRGPGPLLLALGLLAASLALVRDRLEPPPSLPVDAPADRFSAGRALAVLAGLVGDDEPHPVGSPAADNIRRQLLAEFAELGIPAEVQPGLACSARGASCGRIGNVVARLPGRESGPAVLVSAHHDSVAAGPGAGDDGAGVAAILELARALAIGPPPRNPVVFLLVDGEEAGLLGAQAFVDAHPFAADLGVGVNLDAGGTRGVTSITRTSPGNARLIDAFSAVVPRPYGASVIGAVYGLTPYDTDFSVYNKAEIPSIDLGFGEDKAHYHTRLDNLDNLDPASLQHLGDTALALVRRLADDDLTTPHPGVRVFLDALGLTLVAWPALLTPLLALLAL